MKGRRKEGGRTKNTQVAEEAGIEVFAFYHSMGWRVHKDLLEIFKSTVFPGLAKMRTEERSWKAPLVTRRRNC